MLNKLVAFTALVGVSSVAICSNLMSQDLEAVVAKRQVFFQNSDTAPTGPTSWGILTQLDGPNGAFTEVTVTSGSGSGEMWNVGDEGESHFDFIDDSFSSLTALNATWGDATNYTFSYSGGSLGSGTAELFYSGGAFPDYTPGLIGNSWSNAQGFDPTQDLVLTWNEPVGVDFIFIEIEGGELWLNAELDGDATFITISAGTLDFGSVFDVEIGFVTLFEDEEPEFGEALTGTINSLQFQISTVPEPGTVGLIAGMIAFVGAIGYRHRRKKSD